MEFAKKFNITFGKDRYHLQGQMNQWCYENIGSGGWIPDEHDAWYVYCIFGQTTYSFDNEKDLLFFKLVWA